MRILWAHSLQSKQKSASFSHFEEEKKRKAIVKKRNLSYFCTIFSKLSYAQTNIVCLCLLSRLFRFIVRPFQTATSAQLSLFCIHFISLIQRIECLRLHSCFRHINFSNLKSSGIFFPSKRRIQDLWSENYMRKCDFNHRFRGFLACLFDCFSCEKQRQNALVRYSIITAIDAVKTPIGNEFSETAKQNAMNHCWMVAVWVRNVHKFGSAVRISDTAHSQPMWVYVIKYFIIRPKMKYEPLFKIALSTYHLICLHR